MNNVTIPKIDSGTVARKRRSGWLRLAALIFGLGLAIVSLELLLRVAGVGFPNLYEPDHFCGSRLRKSTSGVWTSEGHGTVSINAMGFRGPELKTQKDPNTFRICVLGDSFIEALQVDYEETFCFLLQTKLNATRAENAPVYEVINCGVSGYGTAQEYLLLQNYVLALQPDAVLLAVFCENDIRNNSRVLDTAEARPYFEIADDQHLVLDAAFRKSPAYMVADTSYERTKARLINHSRTLQLLQKARQKQVTSSSSSSLTSEDIMTSTILDHWFVYRAPDGPDSSEAIAWQVTELLLRKISEECRTKMTPLYVFDVPSPIQIWPDSAVRDRIAVRCNVTDWFYSEKRIESVCRELEVPFLPLASEMLKSAESENKFLAGFSESTPGVGHWNQRGHEVAAARIEAWLRSNSHLTLP